MKLCLNQQEVIQSSIFIADVYQSLTLVLLGLNAAETCEECWSVSVEICSYDCDDVLVGYCVPCRWKDGSHYK